MDVNIRNIDISLVEKAFGYTFKDAQRARENFARLKQKGANKNLRLVLAQLCLQQTRKILGDAFLKQERFQLLFEEIGIGQNSQVQCIDLCLWVIFYDVELDVSRMLPFMHDIIPKEIVEDLRQSNAVSQLNNFCQSKFGKKFKAQFSQSTQKRGCQTQYKCDLALTFSLKGEKKQETLYTTGESVDSKEAKKQASGRMLIELKSLFNDT